MRQLLLLTLLAQVPATDAVPADSGAPPAASGSPATRPEPAAADGSAGALRPSATSGVPGWLSLILPPLSLLLGWVLSERSAARRHQAARADRILFENLARRHDTYKKLHDQVRDVEAFFLQFAPDEDPNAIAFQAISEATFDMYHGILARSEPGPFDATMVDKVAERFAQALGDAELWLDKATRDAAEDLMIHMTAARVVAHQFATDGKDWKTGLSDEELRELRGVPSAVKAKAMLALHKARDLRRTMRFSLGVDVLEEETAAMRAARR